MSYMKLLKPNIAYNTSKHKLVFNGDAEYVVAFYVFIPSDKFSFGQTVFLNCLTECLGFSICLFFQ